MLRFAVVGNPVSHSRSPQIHALFARQAGIALQYTREEVSADGFTPFVQDFFASGGRGLNVTVPFKEQAYALASRLTDRAGLARAVNTLYQQEGDGLVGDNTDGVGLLRDLRHNHQIGIAGRRLLLLGAGGAVRGALGSLAGESPASITLVNRSVDKAMALKEDFSTLTDIEVRAYDDPLDGSFDLIINGTSSSLHGALPPLSPLAIGPHSCCYDMMYASQPTAFLRWATEQGACTTLDGLGMLVEQAAESFYIWLGVRPQTADVIRQVRASLN